MKYTYLIFTILLFLSLISCKEDKKSQMREAELKNIEEVYTFQVNGLNKLALACNNLAEIEKIKRYATDDIISIMLNNIITLKSAGYIRFTHQEYKTYTRCVLLHLVHKPEIWKKSMLHLAEKKYGTATHTADRLQRKVPKIIDTTAYVQAGVNILTTNLYTTINDIAELQDFLAKLGVEEKYRTPINTLD